MNPSYSEHSLFGRELPQSQKTLEVTLPKGIKAPLTARAAGAYVKPRKYGVTVTPHAGPKTHNDEYLGDDDLGNEAESVEVGANIRDERSVFRKERARRFHISCHFPALVSPRIVPHWKPVAKKLEAASQAVLQTATSHHSLPLSPQTSSNNLLKPTISYHAKHRSKIEEQPKTPWLGAGLAGASDRVCDRIPTIHQGDVYGAQVEKQREELETAKQRWLQKEPIRPVGKATTSRQSTEACMGGAGIMPSNMEPAQINNEIRRRRIDGQEWKRQLQKRYEDRRALYQKKSPSASTAFDLERVRGGSDPEGQNEEPAAAPKDEVRRNVGSFGFRN